MPIGTRFGKVYLIPSPIGAETPALAPEEVEKVRSIHIFAIEEPRTARRFLGTCGMPLAIADLQFITLNKDSTEEPVSQCIKLLQRGEAVGVISEAGMPGIADPGALLVASAHQHGVEVVPLVGATSIILTLAASGLNGQHFAFLGYLPVKGAEFRNRVLAIEARSRVEHQTQVFIETPYRNDKMLAELLSVLSASTLLCIANGIHWSGGSIRTQRVREWREHPPTLGKLPTVFALQAEGH